MGYTQVGLEQKILEMYPEISQHGISAGISFDELKNAWIIKFKKDGKELTTHLEKKDADDCMNNIKCVYLGIQVEQFIKNFGMRK
jgi:dolichyl-phosphate-mannose--protein O-mannosyl transferase